MDKSLIARELRRFWLYKINESTTTQHTTVANWLTKGVYTWDSSASAGSFKISIPSNEIPFRDSFCAECARFSSAALETFIFSDPPLAQRKSLGWSLIKAYYGAFFSAHALMRSFGRSVCHINSEQARSISKIAALQTGGVSPQISPGIFSLECNSRSTELSATNLISKGSHEQLWMEFSRWLDDARTGLTAAATYDSLSVADCLKNIKSGLSSAGANNGAWLSVMRNQVNYSQQHGVWFPYTISDRSRDGMTLLLGKWSDSQFSPLPPLIRGKEIDRFLEICTSISSILLGVLTDISLRCPKGRSFVDQKALPLLRQVQGI